MRIHQAAWQASLDGVRDATPGLVPVAKGNGYGFGLGMLAAEANRLGADTLAVGTPGELPAVADFRGEVVVLMPWPEFDPGVHRNIPTIGTLAQLRQLSGTGARVLVEAQTSMRRHGLDAAELAEAVPLLDGVDFAGWTIHLPMGETSAEARTLARQVTQLRPAQLWLSHVTDETARQLSAELNQPVRLRRGTQLWLADPTTYAASATVLDLHRVRRGERAGYRRRRVPGDGWIVIVAGGTAHGVALEAPSPAATLQQRARTLGSGGLAALGRTLSPFTIDGRKRWFLEPPHMQSSLVFLPAAARPPAIGDEVDVTVRMTTYLPDAVVVR